MTALARTTDDLQKRIEADGAHTPAQIAKRLLGDVRATPLLLDLNPGLPPSAPVRAGHIVVLPSRNQVRAFARRHGFTVGFDERAANGTDARRKWAALAGDGARPAPPAQPLALAASLVARGVSSAEAGRRLARQCPHADLAALAAHADPRVAEVAAFAEGQRLHPQAVARVSSARALLETTLRPGGFRALCDGLARAPVEGRALLGSLCVSDALADALVSAAPRVADAVRRARAIAQQERGARDAQVAAEPALAQLVSAWVDGVEPLAADRIAQLGLAAEHDAWVAHVGQLRGALARAADLLPRAPLEVLRALVAGADTRPLQRPWPVVARVVCALAERVRVASVTDVDAGLGGLLRPSGASAVAAARAVPVALLQARAAGCARADDEGEAFAARLARTVVALFDALAPGAALCGGNAQAQRAQRRAAFDHAVSARGCVRAEGAVAALVDALEAARASGIGRADRLRPQQVEAAKRAAAALCGPLACPVSVARRPASELGRALVVAAMALEPELAAGLSRRTGEEAFVQTAARHAARVLSAAACAIR